MVASSRQPCMSFLLFLFGIAITIGGLALGLSAAGASASWIRIVCTILFGIGIVVAVRREQPKDGPR